MPRITKQHKLYLFTDATSKWSELIFSVIARSDVDARQAYLDAVVDDNDAEDRSIQEGILDSGDISCEAYDLPVIVK